MTDIYSEQDYVDAHSQKSRCLIYFFIVTGVYVALAAGVFIYFLFEPYGTDKRTLLLVLDCVLTAFYVVFAYLYLAIRFSRVRKYCKMLRRALDTKPSCGTASFMRFNGEVSARNGVDFRSMSLVEWSEKEKNYMERNILLDPEKPLPDLRSGDEINYKTYSNILVGYEVTNRLNLTGTPFGE